MTSKGETYPVDARSSKTTIDSVKTEISELTHHVFKGFKTPGKSFAWGFITVIFIMSLITLIIWFIQHPESFGFDGTLSKTEMGVNGFYYWATVTSTVGFGDICPKTINSKMFTSFYQLFITAASMGALWNITDEAIHGSIRGIVKK